ncbi:alpha-lactalbumin isoform X1 [Oryctolagus cuniculus]|uniref:Alpha-lactalbumin n=2 Tax=Oryctolagus cuniculus TaxID=9986 RepID=LALBA_RABIT|nr:alpha-lactalbumin precursor [Oryctolagus cuniculus]XP_008254616.1 alpha-lactalbumin isoform X1 [Oryctolagus cuniculus]XP_017197107.1 alpha-lactalbumin isoform X1 [Oryctolagus cuniculus]XP_051700837.1 alpha-lactalbumin isoform X1 [Oryctolagus cuniculus]XP_051700838.1 alpha-lactalbumin isoform X1 [Oryctolagus cuniculus]P00716.2 RecName: Full=Alpha-lactalbumin; AltName: Full=Lactose synthase B protein; Flags: Precursor [Oryctolagus cuniculus]AAD56598.1 alpha-lactalbumin precursor [Oryctolagus
MMPLVPLLLVSIVFPGIQATQLTRCELTEKLKELDGYRDISMSEWICTLFHTSGLDTKITVNNNGSTEYGIFQISDKLWCVSKQNPQSKNICDTPCENFLDDNLTDDVKCAMKILDKEGIDHWLAHKPLCSENLEQWVCKK